jgi:hypothetical protein
MIRIGPDSVFMGEAAMVRQSLSADFIVALEPDMRPT